MSDYNAINGSSSALGEGSFRRRDELRRAESIQRQKQKMNERLDRNISRAVRKGDARSAEAFNSLRQSISGQGFQASGGINNADDREQRVAEGTIQGAKIRYDMGNIGKVNNGMIAEAPPVDSVTPKNRPAWDGDGNGIPNSIQRPSITPTQAPEGVQTAPVAPSSQMDPKALKSRQAFASELDRSELIKSDPAARERAYAKGESIGVSRGEINRRQGWGADTGPPSSAQFSPATPDNQSYQSVADGPSEFSSLTKPSDRIDFSYPGSSTPLQPIGDEGARSTSEFATLTEGKPAPASRPSPVIPAVIPPRGIAGTVGSLVGKVARNNIDLAGNYYGKVAGAAGAVAGKSLDVASSYYGNLWGGAINAGGSFIEGIKKTYASPPANPLPR